MKLKETIVDNFSTCIFKCTFGSFGEKKNPL